MLVDLGEELRMGFVSQWIFAGMYLSTNSRDALERLAVVRACRA
jgi:hypothetical protein